MFMLPLLDEQNIWWDLMLSQGEDRLRQLCAERGLDWDKLTEEEREIFVDNMLHEKYSIT
mgnify:CR=1 FL=1